MFLHAIYRYRLQDADDGKPAPAEPDSSTERFGADA
jgi:hypothetical protein